MTSHQFMQVACRWQAAGADGQWSLGTSAHIFSPIHIFCPVELTIKVLGKQLHFII